MVRIMVVACFGIGFAICDDFERNGMGVCCFVMSSYVISCMGLG